MSKTSKIICIVMLVIVYANLFALNLSVPFDGEASRMSSSMEGFISVVFFSNLFTFPFVLYPCLVYFLRKLI